MCIRDRAWSPPPPPPRPEVWPRTPKYPSICNPYGEPQWNLFCDQGVNVPKGPRSGCSEVVKAMSAARPKSAPLDAVGGFRRTTQMDVMADAHRELRAEVISEDSWNERRYKKVERRAAFRTGVKWRFRGPPEPQERGRLWMKQKWRKGSRRWANRGGIHRAWYERYYRSKRWHALQDPAPHTRETSSGPEA